MITLIFLSLSVSCLALFFLENSRVSLLLSVSVTFTLWVGIQAVTMHALVDWREHFFGASIGITLLCYFLIFLIKFFISAWIRKRRQNTREK